MAEVSFALAAENLFEGSGSSESEGLCKVMVKNENENAAAEIGIRSYYSVVVGNRNSTSFLRK